MARKGENIHKRKSDGRWEGRCWYCCDETLNEWKYKYVYGRTYEEVKAKKEAFMGSFKNPSQPYWLKEIILAAEAKNSLPRGLSFTEIAKKWFADVNANRKKSTYVKYESVYRKHIEPAMQGVTLDLVTDKFVKEKIFDTLSSYSLRGSAYCIVNQILAYAGEIYSLEVPKVRKPATKAYRKKPEPLSRAEQEKFLQVLYEDMDVYKAAMLLNMNTGMRIGEVCALKWSDFDFGNMTVRVERTVQRLPVEGKSTKTELVIAEPKTASSWREIPVPENIMGIISELDKSGEYVFCGKKPLEPRTLQKRFARVLKDAGIRHHRCHDMRHTFATNSIAIGADVKSVSDLLGHAGISTTMNLYVHPAMEMKRKCVEKLGSFYEQLLT